jgi:hypothetical protein
MKHISRIGCIALVIMLCRIDTVSQAQGERQTYDGLLPPYAGAPPLLPLSPDETKKLVQGDMIFRPFRTARARRFALIFRVNAPPHIIWSVITDFNSYPTWIKRVKEIEVYKKEKDDIYVRFRIDHWLFGSFTYHVHHHFPWRQQGWGTWKLDDTKRSDFKAVVGFWRVLPAADEPNQSVVFYSCDIRFKKRKLPFMRNMAIKSSLKQASQWVKEQSEARWTH